jgi:hypothetical protein
VQRDKAYFHAVYGSSIKDSLRCVAVAASTVLKLCCCVSWQ